MEVWENQGQLRSSTVFYNPGERAALHWHNHIDNHVNAVECCYGAFRIQTWSNLDQYGSIWRNSQLTFGTRVLPHDENVLWQLIVRHLRVLTLPQPVRDA